jgi:hypothetical protein
LPAGLTGAQQHCIGVAAENASLGETIKVWVSGACCLVQFDASSTVAPGNVAHTHADTVPAEADFSHTGLVKFDTLANTVGDIKYHNGEIGHCICAVPVNNFNAGGAPEMAWVNLHFN